MGLFNYVDYTGKCPACGEEISYPEWQTKDGDLYLRKVQPWEVKNFYSPCPRCNTWVSASVDANVETVVTVHKCEVTLGIDQEMTRHIKYRYDDSDETPDSTPT